METNKELKKLGRKELLEIILEQVKRIENLEKELQVANEKIESKRIIIEESGSLSEAVLKLNGMFESAQKSIDQYILNIKLECEDMKNKTALECEKKLNSVSKKETKKQNSNKKTTIRKTSKNKKR